MSDPTHYIDYGVFAAAMFMVIRKMDQIREDIKHLKWKVQEAIQKRDSMT